LLADFVITHLFGKHNVKSLLIKGESSLFENDGKAVGFLHKSWTVKIFPSYGITIYQRGRSTEAAFHDLVQKIEGSLNQKEFTLGVFLESGYRWSIC
jgi:hypothetical protein